MPDDVNQEIVLSQEEMDELFCLRDGRYVVSKDHSHALSIVKREHPESSFDYKWDDVSMGDLFSLCYKHLVRFCPQLKSWYAYDGKRWAKDASEVIVNGYLKDFVRVMYLYAAIEIPDDALRKNYMAFVFKLGDRRARARVLKDAAECCVVDVSEFDSDPYLINCQNGTFSLRDLSFREHNSKDMLTMITSFRFGVNWRDATFPRFDSFIEQVTCDNAHLADYLQRCLGYSMLGDAKEDCMFILHGRTTRNGKSTLLGAITHLLGDYATVAPISIICRSRSRGDANGPSPVLASLRGRRFVTMSESDAYGKLDEYAIKQFTGGEAVMARELYAAPFSFIPQFKMWLSCNELPAAYDRTIFSSERIRIIEFNRHFDDDERDKGLRDLFMSDEAMRYIFAWLVKGWILYSHEGLWAPQESVAAVKEYEADNDLIAMFFDERCVEDEAGRVSRKALYDAYRAWCRRYAIEPLFVKAFLREMDRFGKRIKYNGDRYFKGFILSTGYMTNDEDKEEIEEKTERVFGEEITPMEKRGLFGWKQYDEVFMKWLEDNEPELANMDNPSYLAARYPDYYKIIDGKLVVLEQVVDDEDAPDGWTLG